MAITLPVLSRAASDDNDFADVYANDAQLVTEIDARDDNYQTIFSAQGLLSADLASTPYMLGSQEEDGNKSRVAKSGDSLNLTGGTPTSGHSHAPNIFYFDDADYAISSKTQKLRLRAQVAANATVPAITLTVGLYPVTVAGGSDLLVFTLGTVTTGSTVAHASPSASTVTQANSGDFTIPADGAYALGVALSGTLTNNAAVAIYGQLQTRWV